MDKLIEDRIKEWTTSSDYSAEAQKEIADLVAAGDEKELIDRFYQDLEFGTGGLRGIRGAGSNRMNVYNVMKVTQGLANYVLKNGGAEKGVVMGRDSRLQSDEFSQAAAGVFVANGIQVYYFNEIHPTPTVSFGIRHYGAMTGVMVTASHNPKEYNGYKVFWDDGAQVTPPHDTAIIDEVKNITTMSQVKKMDFPEVEKSDLFQIIDDELDPIYLDMVKKLSIHPEAAEGSDVKICYSPLHGTGFKMVPESMKQYGFSNIILVKEQYEPDGNFPTASYPNPEAAPAMELGIKYAKENEADIFIATDPDADRIGACLRKKDGSYQLLNGNEIATILVYYVFSELKATGKLPKNPRLVTTIVTTPILSKIVKGLGMESYETLTGFKWIGLVTKDMIKRGESFVFGCEESHGYNASNDVRDKDAVSSASLFAELTAFYRGQGKSVVEVLDEIYSEFGYHRDSQVALKFPGIEGAAKIQSILSTLRENTPKKIGKWDVLTKIDIKTDETVDIQAGKVIGKSGLPTSNVIVLNLSGGARAIARPSGTEPKIKFYFTTSGNVSSNIDAVRASVDADHEELKKAFLAAMGIEE